MRLACLKKHPRKLLPNVCNYRHSEDGYDSGLSLFHLWIEMVFNSGIGL